VVDALRGLLAAVVEAERRAAALDHRLARIADLSGGGDPDRRA